MTVLTRPRRHDPERTTALSSSARRASAFTLVELVMAIAILIVIAVPVAHAFINSSRGFSSLATRSSVATRLPLVLDRVVGELRGGSFSSLHPAVPQDSRRLRFRRIERFSGTTPVHGNPVQIDLKPAESGASNGVDDDGDGLVDEMSLRIWEDAEPWGSTPGSEDAVSVVAANLSTRGISFTRRGALIEVVLEAWYTVDGEDEPQVVRLTSAVRPRNQ